MEKGSGKVAIFATLLLLVAVSLVGAYKDHQYRYTVGFFSDATCENEVAVIRVRRRIIFEKIFQRKEQKRRKSNWFCFLKQVPARESIALRVSSGKYCEKEVLCLGRKCGDRFQHLNVARLVFELDVQNETEVAMSAKLGSYAFKIRTQTDACVKPSFMNYCHMRVFPTNSSVRAPSSSGVLRHQLHVPAGKPGNDALQILEANLPQEQY